MIRFDCDYLEGAHERILRRLFETNLEQTPGYGEDEYSARARRRIRALCDQEKAEVHFLMGGTQTNATLIRAVLRPHQGVVAASTGHVNVHEAGAIEAGGHKVLALPNADGKVTALAVRRLWEAHWNDETREHMVQPGLVYISQPTELGTLYSKAELTALWETCQECGLWLYVDGARLGYGVAAPESDMDTADIAQRCHAFSLGGTKQGLLFGEALVILAPALQRDFRYILKQQGGLLAKGRLLGLQFDAMLEDDLYFDLAREAVALALDLRRGLEDRGIPLLFDSPTNQQYPIFPDPVLARLEEDFSFAFWSKVDAEHTAVRMCTSWATERRAIQTFFRTLDRILDEYNG
jgi:threonine aldolase